MYYLEGYRREKAIRTHIDCDRKCEPIRHEQSRTESDIFCYFSFQERKHVASFLNHFG
jgi:hypothetical protein